MAGRPCVSADGEEVLKGGPRPPVSAEFTRLQMRAFHKQITHICQPALQSNVRLCLRYNESSTHWSDQYKIMLVV